MAALQVRKRVTAHDSGSALPWLYGIAANVLRRHFREAAVAGAAAHDAGMDWDAVEARLDAQAQRGQLRGALSVLSPAERDLLLLVAWEGLSPAEAARAVGISQVAARSRLHRARQRAARALQPGSGRLAGHTAEPFAEPGEPEMNPLDDLLSAAGRADEITPDAFVRGRASLRAAVGAIGTVGPLTARTGTAGTGTAGTGTAGPGTAGPGTAGPGTAGPGTAGTGTARRRARPGGRSSLALAGAAVAACAATVTVAVLIDAGGPAVDAQAATLLRAAGNAAGAQPGGWPDAAYWHVTSVGKQGGTAYRREIWVSHHGDSVLRTTEGGHSSVLPLGPGEFPAGGTTLTWDQLYTLPTDPGQLTAVLQADIKGAGPNPESELFTIVGDLLRESPAPPALRKALYDVALAYPWRAPHRQGHRRARPGAGTGVERDGETLVVDPANGALLADTEYGFSATYVSQAPVSSALRHPERLSPGGAPPQVRRAAAEKPGGDKPGATRPSAETSRSGFGLCAVLGTVGRRHHAEGLPCGIYPP